MNNSDNKSVDNSSEGGPVVESATEESSFHLDVHKEYSDFDEMGLSENLLRGIFSYGYEKPSKVQQRGIVKVRANATKPNMQAL